MVEWLNGLYDVLDELEIPEDYIIRKCGVGLMQLGYPCDLQCGNTIRYIPEGGLERGMEEGGRSGEGGGMGRREEWERERSGKREGVRRREEWGGVGVPGIVPQDSTPTLVIGASCVLRFLISRCI